MRFSWLVGASMVLFANASCDQDGLGGSNDDPYVRPTSLAMEVDYESNAAPYGGFGSGSVFAENVNALFPWLGSAFTSPATVGEMQNVGTILDDSLTVDDILALARTHRMGSSSGSARHHYVLFVDGYFEDSTGMRDDILGVSIGSTGVIAMFKPVIASSSSFSSVRAFVEQTVLVHEFGHEIGLVDNGIAMETPHIDSAHGAHCTNQDCVMFWSNSGGNILNFIANHMSSGSKMLFDANCLADVHAHYGN